MDFLTWLTTTLYWMSFLWQLGSEGVRIIKPQVEAKAKNWIETAIKITLLIFTIGFLMIFLSFLVGYLEHTGILFSITAVPLAVCLLILWVSWSPLVIIIGLAYSFLYGNYTQIVTNVEKTGRTYLKVIMAVLLYQLVLSLLGSVLPFWRNPWLIPALFAVSLAFILAVKVWGVKPWFPRVAYVFLVIYLLGIITVWVAPRTLSVVAERVNDNTIAESIGTAIEKEGWFKGPIKTILQTAWKSTPKPIPTPPPREVGWNSREISDKWTLISRVYDGDIVVYKSPKPFKKLYKPSGREYYENASPPGKFWSFKIGNCPPEGGLMYFKSLDNLSFEVNYQIKRNM